MAIKIQNIGFDAVISRLEANAEAAEKALKATGYDVIKRVPGKVADDVRTVYNIKKSEITPGKKGRGKKRAGRISARGATVQSVQLVYQGRPLTPTHFGMTPKAPPQAKPGQKRRKYKVRAQIKKGQRKVVDPQAFLGGTGAMTEDGTQYIPFVRTGRKAYPIEAVKRVSLPQMVSNEDVQERIGEDINQILEARLLHNINRFMRG